MKSSLLSSSSSNPSKSNSFGSTSSSFSLSSSNNNDNHNNYYYNKNNNNNNNNKKVMTQQDWRNAFFFMLYLCMISWFSLIYLIADERINHSNRYNNAGALYSVESMECKRRRQRQEQQLLLLQQQQQLLNSTNASTKKEQQNDSSSNKKNNKNNLQPIQLHLPLYHRDYQQKQKQKELEQFFKKSPSFDEFNSNIRFVFTIGLEGTGHHLLTALTEHAPYIKALTPEFQYYQLCDMASSIYNSINTRQGLLSSFCDYNNIDNSSITEPLPNEHELLDTLVQKLQYANEQVLSSATVPLPTSHNNNNNITTTTKVEFPITVPLNSYRMTLEHFGMMSYPSYMNHCRNLNYPNLDLLYRACTIAKVDCGHLYMYRDPYSIIKSTSINRLFNKSPLSAIQLYISQLSIIYTQLQMYSTRTIGCVGFYDTANNNHATIEEIMDPIYKTFGWKEYPFNFTETIQHLYRPPPSVSMEEQRHVVPPQYQVFMKSMEKLSTSIINLCHEQANENKFI